MMESELTAFLATIDTPEFRRNNLAKVRAKAAAAQDGSGLLVPVPEVNSVGLVLPVPQPQSQSMHHSGE